MFLHTAGVQTEITGYRVEGDIREEAKKMLSRASKEGY